jgi:hypothetical protein
MDKKDEQIERKLIQLEESVKEDSAHKVSAPDRTGSGLTGEMLPEGQTDVKSEVYYFSGLGLILTGILLLFNHIHVGTGFFAAFGWGGGGFGLLVIPLLVGIGWVFYDSKNRIGWAIVAAACGLIFFSCLSSLIMTFPTVSLLGLILMLIPLAAGGALLLKSAGGPKGLKQHLRDENLLK